MKIMITGANGLAGQKTVLALNGEYDLLLTDIHDEFIIPGIKCLYESLNLLDAERLNILLMLFKPDFVVHCGAYTDVDGCERERELSWSINVDVVDGLARLSKAYHYHLIHVSTDFIFDGRSGPYAESDSPNPESYYGKEKLASEEAVLRHTEKYTILRTNVLFGANHGKKLNFISWLLTELSAGQKIKIVTDQYNNPNLAEDFAAAVKMIIMKQKYGVYHLGSKEYMNRYEMAVMVAESLKVPQELIIPSKTDDLNQEAKRPEFGGLKIEKAINEIHYNPTPFKNSIELVRRQLEEIGQIQ